MYQSRVRSPDSAIEKAVRGFFIDPTDSGAKLARLARQEGYDKLEVEIDDLYDTALETQNEEALKVLTMIRQPEWVWRDCAHDTSVRFFGFVHNDVFIAAGFYIMGRGETGETGVFKTPGHTGDYIVGKRCTDPRKAYISRSVRHKVYKYSNKYWVCAIGRVVDLVKSGIDRRNVQTTNGKGYFKKVPAFARLKGPFGSPEEAREARASL